MQRVLFVDVLRLIALLQMINGHTLDAVLAESARLGPGYERYRFVRGLVSVAFLVVAGISFHLTTLVRFERHRSDPAAVRRRLWRAGEIVLVGSLLQLRWPSVYLDPLRGETALRGLYRCEVLQCIGLSLLMLELLTLWLKSARQVTVAAGLTALALFTLSPFAELASAAPEPSLWRSWIGHAQGSQFPLLPWSGYVFAGVVLGRVALPESGRTGLARRVVGLGAFALVTLVLSRAALHVPLPHVAASSSPWFVLQKLSVIALFLGLIAILCQRLRTLPSALGLLGGETLAIFVFHLQVIYGSSWSLARLYPRSLPLSHALIASLFNLALSVAFAFAWRALKEQLPSLRGALSRRIAEAISMKRSRARGVSLERPT